MPVKVVAELRVRGLSLLVGSMRDNRHVLKYVDLFSGCGGLSLGIEEAGATLVTAVEKSDMAARTFYHNFVSDVSDMETWQKYLDKSVLEQAQSGVVVNELAAVLNDSSVMAMLREQELDIVVGGPPCQGFSLAGRRDPSDIRNLLPWQYLDFVAVTTPKAVVIENVLGMNQKFSSQTESSFAQLRQALAETGDGYVVQGVHVNAMHYGAPQHRPRLMLIALRQDIAKQSNITATEQIWKSDFLDCVAGIPDLAPEPTVASKDVRTVRTAVNDLRLGLSSRTKASTYVRELNERLVHGLRKTKSLEIKNHVPRSHASRTVERFYLYQYLQANGIKRNVVSMPTSDNELSRKFVKEQLGKAVFPAVVPDGTLIANNIDELVNLIIRLRTKKHSQKVLEWNEPARTVVTLPDDYVHPSEPRIFTVRELARFQGFPDAFEFLGKETTGAQRRKIEVPQYSQVGNAVSPWLSYAVGQKLGSMLN